MDAWRKYLPSSLYTTTREAIFESCFPTPIHSWCKWNHSNCSVYVFICYMIDEKCELLCIVHNKWNEKPTLLESHFWYLHELRLASDGLGAASD